MISNWGNEAVHAGRPPQQVAVYSTCSQQSFDDKTLSFLASPCVYPWCAVTHQEFCVCQFWFFVLFLAEMAAHQSPYRTGVLFLPILASLKCHKLVSKLCQFWHVNIPGQECQCIAEEFCSPLIATIHPTKSSLEGALCQAFLYMC